jgi:hypothetical protein
MRWAWVVLAAMTAACGQPAPRLEPAPAVAAADPDPALRAHAGDNYAHFVTAAGARYAPEAMGLSALDRTRLWRAMAAQQAAEIVTGGGAEALVFRGCAAEGCEYGFAVVAVDTATGGVFVGVRDVGGADVLARDERVLALLEATAATHSWDEPGPALAGATTATP